MPIGPNIGTLIPRSVLCYIFKSLPHLIQLSLLVSFQNKFQYQTNQYDFTDSFDS